MNLHRIETNALDLNLTHFWGRQNALLTAGDRTGCNAMTIGWGQAGRLWNLPVCTVYVRPERYTYQFLEAQDYFTLSVLPESEKKTILLRFFKGLTQAQAARILKVSQVQVSRLERRALERLRQAFAPPE